MSDQVRLIIRDDLERSRLTVFFRLLISIPHLIWLYLFGSAVGIMVFINWFVLLFRGEPLATIHEVVGRYLRAVVHVYGFLFLAANPYPPFLGEPGRYPIDLDVPPPARQNRWKTGFRIILALPAVFFGAALIGSAGARTNGYNISLGVAVAAAFVGWFAILARGSLPRGLRDLINYALAYTAQLDAYLFLVTDRYPNADPIAAIGPYEFEHPVRLVIADENLERSRLTVFFRFLLAIPHLLFLLLWAIVAYLAAIVNWFATLFGGRSPEALHRFLSSFIRYSMHVTAFLYLTASPFPGFTGRPGTYPVSIEIAPRERQNRWKTGFRFLLAVPAILIGSGYTTLLSTAGFLAWFASLFTARAPRGLRNASAVALRYQAQLSAYLFLLTDRYPYSGPTDPQLAAPPVPEAPAPPVPPLGVA
jgi:hypothetical protein